MDARIRPQPWGDSLIKIIQPLISLSFSGRKIKEVKDIKTIKGNACDGTPEEFNELHTAISHKTRETQETSKVALEGPQSLW
jgi:hypothetical protein